MSSLDKHHGEGGALLGVDPHDAAQQEDVVGGVGHLLRVQHDLLELARLRETLDYLKKGGEILTLVHVGDTYKVTIHKKQTVLSHCFPL
jgi:hypothetical protein